ncbi:MAG: DUF6922 domain-containing protein [Flavobacterium sp.]
MKQKANTVAILPKHLFWDLDIEALNLEDDKAIIIPRAMYATTAETFENDIERLEQLYSPKVILEYLKCTKENISNNVCLSVAKRYNVAPFFRFSLQK